MRFLIVGFGFMGQTHCGNLLKMPGCEVAGIVDPVPPLERLRTVKGNLPTVSVDAEAVKKIPHCTDLDAALETLEADAAVICLPTFLHEKGTLAALARGLHVFVEKPFALTEESCRRMIGLAAEKKLLIAVGYVVRASSVYAFLRETAASGRLGRLKFLQLRRTTGFPAWGNWKDPATVAAVGGSLFDLVSHDIDFARFVLGEPEKITVDPFVSGEFDGNYTAAAMHYKQTLVSVEGGFVTPPGFPFSSSYRAFFEKGTLTGDSEGRCLEYDPYGRCHAVDVPPCDPYFEEMRRFADAVSGKGDPVCTGVDAAKTVCCCNEIRRQLAEWENDREPYSKRS